MRRNGGSIRTSAVRFIARLLLWGGLALFAYVGATLAYARIFQSYTLWKFDRQIHPPEASADLREGAVLGKLEIPSVDLAVMVLQGTGDETLADGAGHVLGTPLPGTAGNVAIAAHRDTFFRNLKGIQRGVIVYFSTGNHTYRYVVDSTETVDPEDTRVLESREEPELTLITCFPFYFVGAAPKRFVVHARQLN